MGGPAGERWRRVENMLVRPVPQVKAMPAALVGVLIIPEFKSCAARVEKMEPQREAAE